MKLTLPPRIGGTPLEIDTADSRHVVIIGANGSGKTRFANRLASDIGASAFRMSALKALYGKDREDTAPGSIDTLYREAAAGSGLLRDDLRGEFERMLALMVNQELLNLIDYKYRGAHTSLPRTRLDSVLDAWRRIFPDNKVLLAGGSLLFGRETSTYSPARLSDGEKAVLYYIGALTFAPEGAMVMVDSPDMFLHPSSIQSLWDSMEQSRPDCTFVYVTHDLGFASSRTEGAVIWVRGCNTELSEWDYDFLPSTDGLGDEVYMAILGARKPVLFIEGDGVHSLDAKLYPLIFNDHTVKSLGGCDRVIESTRTFNSLRSFHNLNAFGIVDRDRRDEGEVRYLRGKQVLVPEVAEIENIFMLEEVVRAMARANHRNPDEVFDRIRRSIIRLFETDLRQQALQHTRHRVKRTVEHCIDGRFPNIAKLEEHMAQLTLTINPRGVYERLCREFRDYVRQGDYASVLRVYNRKTMISESHVARHCGLRRDDKDVYIRAVLDILRRSRPEAAAIRSAIRSTFHLSDT